MFVFIDDDRIALLLRNGDRGDFGIEVAGLLRRDSLVLARHGHLVLVFAADLVVGGNVLGGLGHRVDAVLGLHPGVDEAPADGGVLDGVDPAEGAVGLGDDERGAAHGLDSAGDHQTGFTGLDGARRGAERVEPGAAQAVDGRSGNVERQAGEQQGHARDVAVVFAGLVGTAVDDVGHGGPVDRGIAFHQRLERDGAEVVGAYGGQGSGIAPERGTDGVANVGLAHGSLCRCVEVSGQAARW